MTRKKPGVIIVGGYVNGLNAARALSDSGVPVFVIATRPNDIAHFSRASSGYMRLRNFHDSPETLLGLLLDCAEGMEGWLILPTNDQALEIVSRNRDLLVRSFRVPVPPWEIVRPLLQKDQLHRLCLELGIAIPRDFGPATSKNLFPLELEFPVVVKPRVSHVFFELFQQKLFFARNQSELSEALRRIEDADIEGNVLDFIPGDDGCFYNYSVYLDRAGSLLARCPMHKLRKSPARFGVCRVGEVERDEELIEQMHRATLSILNRVGWYGMANAEFKLDPRTGRLCLMEINGRCFLMHGLALQAGVNYPLLTWKEFATEERVEQRYFNWPGCWIHLHADLLYSTLFWKDEELSRGSFLEPYRRPRAYAVWSIRDPLPFLRQWLYSAKEAMKMPIGSLRSSIGNRMPDRRTKNP